MKKIVIIALIALLGSVGLWPLLAAPEDKPRAALETDGPYTFAYEIFKGDYKDNGAVFARLHAALRREGLSPSRSIAFYLDDPKNVPPRERRCVCGVIVEERDWPRLEALSGRFAFQHLARAKRIVAGYPITGPDSYAAGSAACYPRLFDFARDNSLTPYETFEIYDNGRNAIAYVMSAAELETALGAAAWSAGGAAAPSVNSAVWPDPDWQASTPEAQGMDSRRLKALLEEVPALFGPENIDSLLAIRRGKMVLEVYFAPNKREYRHELHSVTKSVLGTLVGAAIQRGLIRGLDERVGTFLPAGADKGALTVGMLLDMSSGLAFNEFPLNGGQHMQMMQSPDWTAYALGLPLRAKPGAFFNYSDADVAVANAVLRKAAGKKTAEFAAALFGPLGIRDFRWNDQPDGNTMGNDGLFLTSRDLAKIGYLYLLDGVWKGTRILPAGWAGGVLTDAVATVYWPMREYGKFWWVDKARGIYAANGSAGQMLILMPRQDMVAVVTAKHPMSSHSPNYTEVADRILSAVASDRPLSGNPQALKALADRVARFASPPPRPAGELPAMARSISGKTFLLEKNPPGFRSLLLRFGAKEASVVLRSDSAEETYPIGLDGLYRTTPRTPQGIRGTRGSWEDERTFVIQSRPLEGDFMEEIRITFTKDRATIHFVISDELWNSFTFNGRAAE